MAYAEKLAERIRQSLADRGGITEKKMFGGLAFLLEAGIGAVKSSRYNFHRP